MKIMNTYWGDVLVGNNSTRYLVKLESSSRVNETIQQSLKLVSHKVERYRNSVLNFCFHIESSLLYICPCQRSDLLAEIDVKAMLQFLYDFSDFEAIESKFYSDEKFRRKVVDDHLKDFFASFGVDIRSQLEQVDIKAVFTVYLYDDDEGLYLKEFNIAKYLN